MNSIFKGKSTASSVPLYASSLPTAPMEDSSLPNKGESSDSLQTPKPHGHRKRQFSVSDHKEPRLAQQKQILLGENSQCSLESLPQLKVFPCHFYTLLTTEVQLRFVQRLSSHPTKLLLSLKRTRRGADHICV